MMRTFFSFVWGLFNVVFRAYLFSVFWVWFVMSQFTNLPALSVAACLGLSLLVSLLAPTKFLTAKDVENSIEENKSIYKKYMGLINNAIYTLIYLFVWGWGAIIYYFFM